MPPERAKEIQSKGGKRVSENREYMRAIGRIGGIQTQLKRHKIETE